MSRRKLLPLFTTRFAVPALAACLGTIAYAFCAAKIPGVTRIDVSPRHLPPEFGGLKIAFLADTHYGPFVPLAYLERVVEMTNALEADIVVLGGDYIQRRRTAGLGRNRRRYIMPGIRVLGALRAPLGRFAVLGNHDYRTDAALTRHALAVNGFKELTNTGVWLERGGARLRIGGVDDCRVGRPRLSPALGDLRADEACVLITHNPDFVERIHDPRVDLVLCGHTHGGQIVLPFIGAPVIPSRYGQKYREGMVQGPVARAFVTRGVGTIWPPLRFACPPEVVLLTLRCGGAVGS